MKRDVDKPESIADHMYRMGLMALIAADIPGVNRDKCVKMAIVHDIAEAIVGDITPSDGIPKLEKSRMEQEAMEKICNLLGGGPRAKEISDLWMEYEENTSLEAKVVKDFDKVEMILQALEYEQGKVRTSSSGGIFGILIWQNLEICQMILTFPCYFFDDKLSTLRLWRKLSLFTFLPLAEKNSSIGSLLSFCNKKEVEKICNCKRGNMMF